jgi:hypothetical protein
MQETDDDVLAALDLRMTAPGGLVGENGYDEVLREAVRNDEKRS